MSNASQSRPPSLFKLRRARMAEDREATQARKPEEVCAAAPSGLHDQGSFSLPAAPLVRIEEIPGGDRRMIAARTVPAGTELFHEDAILLVHSQQRDLQTVCCNAFLEFQKKPPDAQKRILSFHAPVQDCDEETIRKFATESAGVSSADEVERFVQLGLIMKANSAVAQQPSECETETDTLGLGLYELGCRANHSCAPNACWMDAACGGGARIFRSLVDISAGTEVTNDYLSEQGQCEPTAQRQKRLMQTKSFLCSCARCSARFDDARRFRCLAHRSRSESAASDRFPSRTSSTSSGASSSSSSASSVECAAPARGCSGWHCALNPSPDNLDYLVASSHCPATDLSPCCRCGATPVDPGLLSECMQAERNASNELDKLNARIDALASASAGAEAGGGGAHLVAQAMEDASALHEALVAHTYLHENHYLVAKAGYVRWEVHRGGGGRREDRSGDMAAGLKSFLGGLRASGRPGVPSVTAAFKAIELARLLQPAAAAAASHHIRTPPPDGACLSADSCISLVLEARGALRGNHPSPSVAAPATRHALLADAVRQLEVACGSDHPFTCGGRKQLKALYRPGCRVRVVGLSKAPQYNARLGTVKEMARGDRVGVLLDPLADGLADKLISLKLQNACPV